MKKILWLLVFLLCISYVSAQIHPADLNQNGCINLQEISAYVSLWLGGGATLDEVSSAVSLWLAGCTPNNGWTFNKYVSPTGAGSHDGSQGNEWTIYEAASNAVAGDVVFIEKGHYDISSTRLTFGNDGIASNPIVFVGEFDEGYDPATVNGDNIAWFYITLGLNGAITVNGDYTQFHNIATYQDIGKWSYQIKGDHVTMDSLVIATDPSISTEHTVIVKPSAQYFTLRNSYLSRSGRTIVWIESSSTEAANNALFEYNTFTGAANHYDIQVMPLTSADTPPINTGLVIRNNVFVDNPYEAAIYLRHISDFKIYNNLFVNSGAPVHYVPHEVGHDVINTGDSLIVYNTIYDVMHTRYWFKNYAANELVIKNNIFIFNDGYGGSDLTMDFRCFYDQPHNQRTQIDYNSYYFIGQDVSNDGLIYWGDGVSTCSYSSYSGMDSWKSATGVEEHGIFNMFTTFEDLPNLDLTPVAGSAVVDAGTPIDGITTDFYGDVRDPSNPTIGAFER